MTGPARRSGPLAAASAGLVASAALLWAGSAQTGSAQTGSAQSAPELSGVALLALAGVAAVVATGGALRRAVGALLAVPGAIVAARAGAAVLDGPSVTGPLLAAAGGVLLLATGLFVLLREPRLTRFGARYARPGPRPDAADPDRAAWQELDAGRDPTADVPAERGDDPREGPRAGAV